MVFSSIPFLFFFLPLCLALYYLVPWKVKNYVLLVFSLAFYAWGEPVYILLMLMETLSDYTLGRLMDRADAKPALRRLFLMASVLIDLSVLGFFKYADFLIETVNALFGTAWMPLGLGLPIGISFFTFQTMSYTIDLYRRNVPVEKNYFYYLTYVSMFPQLIAGPIVRFSTVSREIHARDIHCEGFVHGGFRFLQGLFKKVLIANQIGALWELIKDSTLAAATQAAGSSAASEVVQNAASAVQGAANASVTAAWIGAVCFTLQLYFDFSAYSDMAIGMGEMLGFHYLENFCYPLSAVSVTDFWHRWHISLSTWFRDYVYIPLGGNRHGKWKQLRNMFVVWFLTGLWHGAAWNFVLWGLYYGVLLALEKFVYGRFLEKLPRIFRHVYAIIIVVLGFVLFVFDDMGELRRYFGVLFGMSDLPFWNGGLLWNLRNHALPLLMGLAFAFPLWPYLCEVYGNMQVQKDRRISYGKTAVSVLCSLLFAAVMTGLFLLTTAYLVNDTYNPFLYFRF